MAQIRTCTECGDLIDPAAWPIVVVEDSEPRVFCCMACHDRWRDGWVDRTAAADR